MIQPPYISDHMCRLLHLGVGVVPLLLWWHAPSANAPSAPGVPGLVLASLVLARVALHDLRLRAFVRLLRGRERLRRALILLSAGGASALWPEAWLGGAGPEGAAGSWTSVGWASVLLLVTALGCVQELRTWPDVRGILSRRLQPFWVLRRLTGHGWGPALLAITHPDEPGLLVPAIAVTAAELAFSGYAARTGDRQLQVVNALRLPLQPAFRVPWIQGSVLGAWAYDAVLRRPRKPDLAPWELALRHDEVLAGSPGYELAISSWRANASTPTADAEPWVSTAEAYADSLKALFQHQAGTEIPEPERRRLFTTWQTVAAMTAMARAEVSLTTGLSDNAVRNRRYAAELFAAAGLPLNAAAARCLTADTLAYELDRTAEALAEVDAMGDRTALPAALQRLAELVEGVSGRAGHRGGADRRRTSPLPLGSATALIEELPTWLPYLSVHHRGIAFVRHVERRVSDTAHRTAGGRQPDVVLPGPNRGFADMYPLPVGQGLGEVLADAQRSYARGSLETARLAAMDVLEVARSADDLAQQTAAHRLLARTAARSGNWSEQYTHLISLVASVETARDRVADADLRIDLDLARPCGELVALIVDHRIPGVPLTAAVEAAERGRARLMLQTMGGARDAELPMELVELQRKEQGLLRSVRSGDRIGTRGPYGFAVLNPYWGQVERAKLEEVWRAMEATGAAGATYVSGRRGAPAQYAELRDMLQPGEVLCEFVSVGDRTIVLLVRPDRAGPVVVDLRLGAEALTPVRPDVGRPAPSWTTGLAPLARAVSEHTRPGEVLWLVPDGPLHDLPLHAVTVAGTPWGERNPMSCTPSASLMRYRLGPAARNETRAALVLADSRGDLTHARAEARAIRAVLPSAEVHTGPSATLRSLRERLSRARYDVVHLACHCRLDRERPSRSGILLADGELTAEDLLTVRLDVRLVVLSGCDTGVQEQRAGNELMGLTRQFLHAGARSVLVTRWQVDDVSSALLMADFYRRLKDGSPTAKALSAARRRLRSVSLEQALEHCERERRGERLRAVDPESVRSLSHDIARLRLRAGDVSGALAELDALLAETPDGSPHRRRLLVLRNRAHYASARSDHHLPAFDHPYYWAPFTLVGDWR
ncbi:CHAT domain-containing protein [Streptomyces virginiae]|uniref:CHAT domain-containing protein n=1 Tax=Streptomyces virginiae TaxID=1961 RepID=UPI002DBB6124|nr:CHAT domain-containing protein [Streptomyces sp. CMAA1738]MEC4572513.1 CHAT domain-containing protein [Streptomyces sp. CMAA1738]